MPASRNPPPTRRPGGLPRLVLGLWLALAGKPGLALDEDAMKGAYLHSLVKFVEWPETAPNFDDDRFYICVLGEERLNALANALQQKRAHGRPIGVVSLARHDAKECRVVFIAASESWRLQSLLAELATQPILIVGETERFASRGGMIEFALDNQRLGFAINNGAAQRAGLHIDAQLLQLARLVYK